jgi:hypothetical protein
MLNRRSFLRRSLATGVALHSVAAGATVSPLCSPSEFERLVAKSDSLDLLGRPHSWSLVRDGLHPISPAQVIVMTENGGDGWSSRDRSLEDSLRESLAEPFDLHSWCDSSMGSYHVPTILPVGKLDLIFRLMRVMTDHYRVPNLFPKWATMLAKRETLGSTGMGHGFGLLHQFQDDGKVELANAPVDWWLVLFPGGIEWDAWDGKPVFGMIGHVFPPNHWNLPGLKLRVWELSSRAARGIDAEAWEEIARVDRAAAARVVNRAILATTNNRNDSCGKRKEK